MDNKRIEWIDTAKLLGIFLVILGHLPTGIKGTEYFPRVYIYTFHMPLFFFLSGLTFHTDYSIFKNVKKNIRTLIIPYIFFYVCLYIVWFFIAFLGHAEIYRQNVLFGVIKPFLGLLLGVGFNTPYSIMIGIGAQLWFLPALFWCKTIVAFLPQKNDKKKSLCILIICSFSLVISILLWCANRFLPFSMGSACMALPFFCLGIVSKNLIMQLNNRSLVLKFFLLVLFMLVTGGITFYNGLIDTNQILFGKSPLLYYLGGISGILFAIILAMILPQNIPYFLQFLAKNTISILAFHIIVFTVFLRFCEIVLHIPHTINGYEKIVMSTSYMPFIISLITLILCAIPCYCIQFFFPFVIGRKYNKK